MKLASPMIFVFAGFNCTTFSFCPPVKIDFAPNVLKEVGETMKRRNELGSKGKTNGVFLVMITNAFIPTYHV